MKLFTTLTRPAHISLALIGLMWIVPFLYADHPYPVASFYPEWWAVLLGLCAILVMLVANNLNQLPGIPRIVQLPLALSLLVLLQFVLGRGGYWGLTLLSSLSLLWAALLMVASQRLRAALGLPALATVLAACLLVGAEMNAWVAVLQHYFKFSFLDMAVMPANSAVMFGNLAQPNHFANYIMLGLVSLGLIHACHKLRGWQVLLLALPLLFVLAMSGSRSTWLYLLCITGMAFLWQRRDKSLLPLLRYCLLLILGFGLMNLIVLVPGMLGTHGNVTAAQRLLDGGIGVRFNIWREAWVMFTQNPLLGAGFGQFAWQHFQLGPVLRDSVLSNLNDYVEHAHNIVLHIAAEMGLAGLVVLFGTLTLWIMQARHAPRTIYHWWTYALLAVLAIHSLLEYPLWYTYFLGVAAILLGMLDNTVYRMTWCKTKFFTWLRWSGVAMLLLGLLSLTQMWLDYRKLVIYANYVYEHARDTNYLKPPISPRVRNELVALQGHGPLLQPFVEGVLGEAGWDHVADKQDLNNRVMRYTPHSTVVYRAAMLLARAGQQEAARVQIERAIWTFPDDFPANFERLNKLARIDNNPLRFPALAEFAAQKYAEQQAIAHAR